MTEPSDSDVYETPLLSCWFGEDGILYSRSISAERTIENYRVVFELYRKLSENGTKKFCTLGNITNTRPLDKEVRDFVSKETAKYIKAMALVSASPLGTVVGGLFKTLSGEPYPIAIFDRTEDAVKWLKESLNTEEK